MAALRRSAGPNVLGGEPLNLNTRPGRCSRGGRGRRKGRGGSHSPQRRSKSAEASLMVIGSVGKGGPLGEYAQHTTAECEVCRAGGACGTDGSVRIQRMLRSFFLSQNRRRRRPGGRERGGGGNRKSKWFSDFVYMV